MEGRELNEDEPFGLSFKHGGMRTGQHTRLTEVFIIQ